MVDRNDVLAAAQRVLNADPAASTSAVAEAAGISRATLHRHFDTREALLVELGTRSLDQWEQRLDDVDVEGLAAAGDADRLRAALETLVLGYVDDSDRALLRPRDLRAARRRPRGRAHRRRRAP